MESLVVLPYDCVPRVLMLYSLSSMGAAIITKITCLASLAYLDWNRWRISAIAVSVHFISICANADAHAESILAHFALFEGTHIGWAPTLPPQDPFKKTIRLRL